MNRKNFFVFIFTLLLFSFACALQAAAEDWPQWRGQNRNSFSTETNLNPASLGTASKIVWRIKVQKGYSGLAIKGGRVYTLGYSGGKDTVYCLDSLDGKIIWQYAYAGGAGQHPGPKAMPIIDETRVYTFSAAGDLYCFDAQNGSVIWAKHCQVDFKARSPMHEFGASPLVVDDLIILNACTWGIALNKFTGNAVWVSKPGTGGYAAPVLFTAGGVRGVAIFGEKALYGVELKTGKVLWSYPWLTSYDVNAADPLVFDNKIFITSGYGTGCALLEFSATGIKEVWKNKAIAAHFTSPVLLNGLIYGVHGDAGNGVLRALHPADGSIKLEQRLGFGSFIIVNRILVYLRENGTVTLADPSPSAFTVLAQAKIAAGTHWTPPSFANGFLYIRNDQGEVVCMDLRP